MSTDEAAQRPVTGYSDEDVETAAQAIHDSQALFDADKHPLSECPSADEYRRDAHAVLDAVAPRIAERARAEGYNEARQDAEWYR